jgi:hypothetical protein
LTYALVAQGLTPDSAGRKFKVPQNIAKRSPRAYVVAMGVNSYEEDKLQQYGVRRVPSGASPEQKGMMKWGRVMQRTRGLPAG